MKILASESLDVDLQATYTNGTVVLGWPYLVIACAILKVQDARRAGLSESR